MPTPGTESRAGFTVLELLAVMVVLALAAASLSLGAGRPFGTAQYRALLLEASAAARQARTAAIRGAGNQSLVIDLAGRRLSYPGSGRIIAIPPDVELAVAVAESERYADGTVGIRFLPSGGSTGGTLTFSWRSMTYDVRVNWLTGGVSIDRG